MLKESVVAVLFIFGVAAQTPISIDRDEIAQAHNFVRRGVSPSAANMEVMMYNEELAGIAQTYSQNCQFQHSTTTSSPSFSSIGENIFAGQGVAVNYTSFIVDSWSNSESPDYNFDNNTCNPGGVCGHYTQVVWYNTDNVGCGATRCPTLAGTQFTNAILFVCNYGPAGNIVGRRPYEQGTPCSRCPSNKPHCEANLCSQQATNTEAPSSSTTEAPSSSTTETPSSSTTEAPSSSTTEAPSSSTTEATTESPSPSTIEAITEAPTSTSVVLVPSFLGLSVLSLINTCTTL